MSTKKYHNKIPPFASGLNRRDFIKQSGVATLLAGLLVSKPSVAMSFFQDEDKAKKHHRNNSEKFTTAQKTVLEAVQLQLFPADGDGPSATEINALPYLEWALTDPKNKEDGDREFIISGISWLQSFTKETDSKPFIQLSNKQQQQQLLTQFSKIEKHENWMSILVYYLIEALLLDPVYGGNPNGIGWKWLEHQPGFPRPQKGQTYRELS